MANDNEAPKRKAGRPVEPVIGPAELEQLSEWTAQGWTLTRMANELGVAVSSVKRAIDNRVMPTLREPRFRSLELIVSRVEWMYRKACECFSEDGKPETLKLCMQLQQELSTLLRYRTDKTINILNYMRSDEEFRVAGASPAEVDADMIKIVDQLVEERRNYEQALKERYESERLTIEQADGDDIRR